MDTTMPTRRDGELYDRDLYAWCGEQAALLRARAAPGANDGLDYGNLAEEIETLGRSQEAALRPHLTVLILHLLKWQVQPQRRSKSWENSIANARSEIEYALDDSPSLKPLVEEAIARAYPIAVRQAETETGVACEQFAERCPFSVEQLLDRTFLPMNPDEVSGS